MSFGDRSTPTSPLERGVDPDKDLLTQVKSLLKQRKHLEVGHGYCIHCILLTITIVYTYTCVYTNRVKS